MRFEKVLTFIGAGLLILAWVSAASIPSQAQKDFDTLVQAAGGSLAHTPNFPDTYKQLSANRRMLQNFYVGAAGLICLVVGLCGWKKQVETSAGANLAPR
jgi:hypothetical protein